MQWEPSLSAQPVSTRAQTFTSPVEQKTVLLTLDATASDIITRSEALTLARLDAQMQEALANAREATKRALDSNQSPQQMTVLDAFSYDDGANSHAPASNAAAYAPEIDRLTLSGLITTDNQTQAYLALDNGPNVRVKAGDSLDGVTITHINAKQVSLKQGRLTRVLGGQ
ncbi:type IV pilus biogenesis protein PilP [Moritella viscosa]|uniref:type IV pilus biogenesis protein PilP n=1 Tax=Moritella viscosa TaxID=80854 RepID=UPI0015880741|nr:type IV pilus biogenesis protein PilP [Moritella viscosa]